MKDQSKTKQVLIQEMASLRQRITELEQCESGRKQAEDALRETKEHLEIRVKERTAELEQVNRTLQTEIAKRKQAEEAVKRERQRLDDVLETLPAYVVLLSADYHVPFANRFFRERFGESEGRRCHEYLFHRSAPCEICETYTVLKTAAPHRWEWVGPDGRNYDIFDFPFTDEDGAPLILEVGIDITELKRAKDVLQQAHNELEQRVAERTEELRRANKELQEDITERKRAEEALRKSEHFLYESQRLGHIGSWFYDMTGQLSWSDEMYRLDGGTTWTITFPLKDEREWRNE